MGNVCKGASDCYELNDEAHEKDFKQPAKQYKSATQVKALPSGNDANYFARQINVIIKIQSWARGALYRKS